MTVHQMIVEASVQMAVHSLKNSRMHNSVTASAEQMRDLFCELFHSSARSVARGSYWRRVVIQSHHCTM
jgi:hypothetical protein